MRLIQVCLIRKDMGLIRRFLAKNVPEPAPCPQFWGFWIKAPFLECPTGYELGAGGGPGLSESEIT